MMKEKGLLAILFVAVMFGFFWTGLAMAESCDGKNGDDLYSCLTAEIGRLSKDLESSKAATAPLESEVKRLDTNIKNIQAKINSALAKQVSLEKEVDEKEVDVAKHAVVYQIKTREVYKKLRSSTTLVKIMTAAGTGQLRREMAYRTNASDQDRQLILSLSKEIISLEQTKADLEKQKASLKKLQEDLDKQAVFFRKEVAGAKQYQADLSSKIAQLSAKQQEIISEKQGTFQTTVGDVPLADDAASRPDYNPGFSPAFAIFSFGAPHFKGMSQYGAYGRAKDGQNVDQILKAYYGGMEIKKDYNLDTKIKVAGYGTMDIETYVKRVYEIPNSWGDNGGFEAMKAQAVAARSYALAWTDQGNGGAICTTEACQVYKNSNKGGKWEEAVNATRGWVLWANGKPVKAWFSSTSGGYQQSYTDNYSGHTTPGLWDTPNGRSGWTSQAYEKKAESPWFYKGWYKSRSGDACGRSHPWLNGEEMADILNAWALVVKSGQSDDRVTPNGGCWGGNPYSISELKDRSSGHGGGFGRVEGVNVSYSDGGYTATVTWQTDKGSVSMSGEDFRKAFNLRSPGRIAVKSALFNVEKK